jgi:thiol-disulfide isomerase/thioredoxin
MKKFTLLGSFIATCQIIFAQNVSTTIQPKSILLEEFTGIYCGNCPAGHEIANNLLNANENAYVVAIHSGFFAIPGGDAPDYRISEGEIIDNELGASIFGYPSGAINRHHFNNEMILGRLDWIKSAKTIHAEDAPVNILLTASFDGNNRKLSVKAEIYYTMNVEELAHRLNIVVIENNIKGPQSGMGGGSDYIHNRMLRCFVTPMNEDVWGEQIEIPAQGNFFEFEYDYELPLHINNVPLKPEDIEIIAFVCAGKTEVLNVTGIKPSYANYEKPLMATLLKPKQEIGARYGFDFFELQLKNLSDKTITSSTYEINFNGISRQVKLYAGPQILAFQTKSIIFSLKSFPFIINPSNHYSIKLIALNDEDIEGNTISGSFFAPIETTQKIFVEIKTDLYADENRFLIKNKEGDIVAEFGPYESNLVATYKETITLDKNETYCFEVVDAWWDGMQNPRGSFKLYNEDQELIFQNYNIKLYGDKVFMHTSKELSTIEYGADKQDFQVYYNNLKETIEISFNSMGCGILNILLYSITGDLLSEKSLFIEEGENRKISLPASKYGKGIYLLKINRGTQNSTKKVFIY